MRANKITNNGEVLLDLTQDTATPETVGEGVTFHTADGSPAVGTAKLGGGAELNIAYGDEPPEDTSKLWVKAPEPSHVEVRGFNLAQRIEETLPEPISGNYRGAAVGNKFYLFGTGVGRGTKDVRCFDFETKTWTTLAVKAPLYIAAFNCLAQGTKIYLCGGTGGTSSTDAHYSQKTVYCFDTEKETFTKLGEWVSPSGSLALVGNKVYTFGGGSIMSTNNKILSYNLETGESETLTAKLSSNMTETVTAVVGTEVYIFSGANSANAFTYIYRFDTETETITTLSTRLSHTIQGGAAAVIGSKVYLFGGKRDIVTGSTVYYDDIACFDVETQTLAYLADDRLPRVAASMCPCVVGGKVYLLGGYRVESTTGAGLYLDDIVCFTPDAIVEEGVMLLHRPTTGGHLVKLIVASTLEIEGLVKGVYIGDAYNRAERIEAAVYTDGEWKTI